MLRLSPALWCLCVCLCLAAPLPAAAEGPAITRDVVLVHGLANRHRWSEEFLNTILERWEPGRVFAVYTAEPLASWRRPLAGGELKAAGDDGTEAGTASLEDQAALLARAVRVLREQEGLGATFHVIAHSMGGLVARRYAWAHPGTVAALVTLGTPHHGSPLAESAGWLTRFAGAGEATADLTPDRVAVFNQDWPVAGIPLAPSGEMATVRGACPGGNCWGAYGELALGWMILKTFYGQESDGLVPWSSAVIAGARQAADFADYDHLELVQEREVALAAAEACAAVDATPTLASLPTRRP